MSSKTVVVPQSALQAAEAAIRECGSYLLSQYQATSHKIVVQGFHEKIDDDVTAEEIILDVLQKKMTSEFSYRSEETQQNVGSAVEFIIDPIEGTANYARAIPLFATQIAILVEGTLAAAFIYEPIKDVLYEAILAGGACANKKPITVGSENIGNTVFSGGAGSGKKHKLWLTHQLSKLMPSFRSVRLIGATGLDLSYVASGLFGCHINTGSKYYDYAPGVLMVKEAGGVVTNLAGDEWSEHDSGLIAAAPSIHPQVLTILKSTATV